MHCINAWIQTKQSLARIQSFDREDLQRNHPPLGPTGLELNQGDTKSGRISRTDVAALCVQAMLFPQYTSRATFECYNADTGKPLTSVGLSNLFKAKSDGNEFVSGRERRGSQWESLLKGLEQDS